MEQCGWEQRKTVIFVTFSLVMKRKSRKHGKSTILLNGYLVCDLIQGTYEEGSLVVF